MSLVFTVSKDFGGSYKQNVVLHQRKRFFLCVKRGGPICYPFLDRQLMIGLNTLPFLREEKESWSKGKIG